MSFPRYPKYKASGVEWLGDVPEGWEVDRIKRSVLSSKNGVWGAEPQQDESDIPCVRVADFDRQKLRVELSEPTIRNVVESERVGRVLCKGDLLLEKAGGGDLQPVGCVVLYDDDRPAVCSNFVARVQVAPGMNASFWRYAHAAAYAVRLNTRSIKQTSGIQNLDSSQYFDERAAFPPLPEQTAIAEFLDRETGKIDELVAEQRRLMELLKEKRQAVISHAVTKGLNPHAPMKPSGIEWLGDVPEHWEAGPLKRHIAKVESGTSVNSSDEPVEDGKLGVLKTSCVYRGYFDPTENKTVVLDDIDRVSCPVKAGTLIVSRMNTPELIGAAGLVVSAPSNLYLPDRLWQIYFSDVDVRFVYFWTRTNFYRSQVESVCTGTSPSMKNLGQDQFGCFAIAMPPKNEQAAIASFLDCELAKFDTLTAEAQRAIDLLQERRTALISAAVTGQIDVRQPLKN